VITRELVIFKYAGHNNNNYIMQIADNPLVHAHVHKIDFAH
jgi:hypothetical protein